jgi:hypothetical protein
MALERSVTCCANEEGLVDVSSGILLRHAIPLCMQLKPQNRLKYRKYCWMPNDNGVNNSKIISKEFNIQHFVCGTITPLFHINICIYVRMYVHIHIYIHKYIHTYFEKYAGLYVAVNNTGKKHFFLALTTANNQKIVFRVHEPCRIIGERRRFGGTSYLHLRGEIIRSRFTNTQIYVYLVIIPYICKGRQNKATTQEAVKQNCASV